MSSTINTYAVSLERLKQAAGSGDQSLINAIVSGQKPFLSGIDEIDDDAGFTCSEALAELVNGKISHVELGYLYGYALEALCAHLGKALDPISGGSDWIEEVDELLESKEIHLTLDSLVYGGSPVRIPEPDDFPFIGSWLPDTLPAALAAFQSMDLTGLGDEMTETLTTIREGLELAVKTPDTALVGFLV